MITDAARTQAETNMAAIKPVFGTTGYNIYFTWSRYYYIHLAIFMLLLCMP